MEAINQLMQYGVPGIMLASFLIFLRWMYEQHRNERDECRKEREDWNESHATHTQQLIRIVEKNTEALQDMKNAVKHLDKS